MYLEGTVATNNFNSKSSDINCYVITASSLSNSTIQQIETVHKEFYSNIAIN